SLTKTTGSGRLQLTVLTTPPTAPGRQAVRTAGQILGTEASTREKSPRSCANGSNSVGKYAEKSTRHCLLGCSTTSPSVFRPTQFLPKGLKATASSCPTPGLGKAQKSTRT